MEMFSKISKKILRHKFASGIILILIALSGYWGYTKIFSAGDAVRYASAEVKKGALIVSITGSGQTSVFNQIDIKPKVSGEIVYVGVKNGQEIKAGTLIALLNARDAQKAVRDAEVNLENAKITLEKLRGPEGLAIPKNKEKAQKDLEKAYSDGFNYVANAFLDLPAILTGLRDILIGDNFTKGVWNADYFVNAVKIYDEKVVQFRNDAYAKYQQARKDYDQNFIDYKSATRFSDQAAIEALIEETYNTSKNVAEAVKSANNLIQFYEDKLADKNLKPETLANTFLSSLNAYTGQTNSHLLNLLNVKNGIENDKDAILNSDLDIRSQELAVKQRKNALLDAEEKLADYSVRAPFSGVIAQLQLEKGDSISPSTILGTLITKQKLAEISLNEVDAAKIKTGQKATLTFDAIPELIISGQVAEIDAIGTVSQGVVTYKVKIVFDTQDERVKTAMSVSVAIITDIKQNAIIVPNSAIKTQSNSHYVEIIEGEDIATASAANGGGAILKNVPRRQTVEIGLSNEESTEIISGLKEGDLIVARTILSSAKTTTGQQSSGLRIPGFGAGGGR
jgi:HlyD family secretion protein